MNNQNQSKILLNQRCIYGQGIMNVHELLLDTMVSGIDEVGNAYVSYQKLGDKPQTRDKNRIKLTYDVCYILQKPVKLQKQQETLGQIYITNISKSIHRLIKQKYQQNSKISNKIQQIITDNISSQLDKLDTYYGRESNEAKKVGVIRTALNYIVTIAQLRIKQLDKMQAFYSTKLQSNKQLLSLKTNLLKNSKQNLEIIVKLAKNQYQLRDFLFFIYLVNQYLERTEDHSINSVVVALQPKLDQLSLFIDPIVFAIFSNLLLQIKTEEERRQVQPNREKKQKQQTLFTHTKLNSSLISKIAYINLNGQQSSNTVDLFRSLSRYVFYVSFPKDHNNLNNHKLFVQKDSQNNITFQKQQQAQNIQINQIEEQNFKSKLEQQFRDKLQYDGKDVENNKNIFIFPLHSKPENSSNVQNFHEDNALAQHYESYFVYHFIMKTVVRYLNEFSPNLIVVSYNGKVHIENYHFAQIIKAFAVQCKCRLIFYPNMSQCFTDLKGFNLLNNTRYYSQQSLKKSYNKHLNLSENDDLFQKIQIFHTIASGKGNLNKINTPNEELQRFRNIQILPYLSKLYKIIAPSNQNLRKFNQLSSETLNTYSILVQTSKYERYKQYFPEDTFTFKILAEIRKLIFTTTIQQSTIKNQVQYLKMKYFPIQLETILKAFETDTYVQQFSRKERLVTYLKISSDFIKQFQYSQPYQNLYPVSFYTKYQGKQYKINLTDQSQVLYSNQSSQSQQQIYLVYVLNHLFDKNQWKNYYGIVRKSKHSTRNSLDIQGVQLFEFEFPNKERQLKNNFVVYSDWNYHETKTHCFLYWPIKFDLIEDKLSTLTKISYKRQQMLSSRIFYADVANPSVFKQLEYSFNSNPKYRCNAFSFQDQNSIEMYIFGGQQFSSKQYTETSTLLTKLIINKKDMSVKSNQFKHVNLPNLSEMQVIKNRNKLFLLGGYGSTFGSLFQIKSGYFYEVNFEDMNFEIGKINEYIKKHNIADLDNKFKKNRIQTRKTPQYHINIRTPLKLKENTKQIYINNKKLNQLDLSPTPLYCQASKGYVIKNYQYFLRQKKLDKTNEKVIDILQFQEYSFIDPTYYTFSIEYKNFLNKIYPSIKEHSMTPFHSPKSDEYLVLKSSMSEILVEYDYTFIPTAELLEIRKRKFNERIKLSQPDIIKKVSCVAYNLKKIIIMFCHPRITNNEWTLAVCNFTSSQIDQKKKQIRFTELTRLANTWDKQSKYFLNILNNNDILISKHNNNILQVYCFKQGKSCIHLEYSNRQLQQLTIFQAKTQQFKFLTYSIDNVVIIIKYKFNKNGTDIQIDFQKLQLEMNNQIQEYNKYHYIRNKNKKNIYHIQKYGNSKQYQSQSNLLLTINWAEINQSFFDQSYNILFQFTITDTANKQIAQLFIELENKLFQIDSNDQTIEQGYL